MAGAGESGGEQGRVAGVSLKEYPPNKHSQILHYINYQFDGKSIRVSCDNINKQELNTIL